MGHPPGGPPIDQLRIEGAPSSPRPLREGWECLVRQPDRVQFPDHTLPNPRDERAGDGVRKILSTGTGADRQLKVFEETKGDLKAAVDYMAKETAEGL